MMSQRKKTIRGLALGAAALFSTTALAAGDAAGQTGSSAGPGPAAPQEAAPAAPPRGPGPGYGTREFVKIDRLMVDARRASAQGDTAQAEKFILEAIEIAPEDPRLQWELASFYEYIGDNEKAEKARVKSLSLMPAEQREAQMRALEERMQSLDKEKAELQKMLDQLKAAGAGS